MRVVCKWATTVYTSLNVVLYAYIYIFGRSLRSAISCQRKWLTFTSYYNKRKRIVSFTMLSSYSRYSFKIRLNSNYSGNISRNRNDTVTVKSTKVQWSLLIKTVHITSFVKSKPTVLLKANFTRRSFPDFDASVRHTGRSYVYLRQHLADRARDRVVRKPIHACLFGLSTIVIGTTLPINCFQLIMLYILSKFPLAGSIRLTENEQSNRSRPTESCRGFERELFGADISVCLN